MLLFLIFFPSPGAGESGYTLRFARLGEEDISGNNQTVEAGLTLPQELRVQVFGKGRPVSGVPVRFAVISEPAENRVYSGKPARLSDTLVITDQDGLARTRLTLGSGAGDYRVRVTGGQQELIFSFRGLRRHWLVFTLIESLGGLAVFLFGLYYGAKALRRLAGNRLREVLFSLTSNRLLGLLVGVGVTLIFQSSTATIGLLVSLASAGLLSLSQSLGVILGADIGTTITVQLLAFRIFDYALVGVFLGLMLMNSWSRVRDIGQVVFGFSLVFYSLQMVLSATEPLRFVPGVQAAIASAGQAPFLGLLVGLFLTAIIRSSAATLGILVGFAFAGLVSLRGAIPFILGANLGSAFSAVIASWRGTTEARRIAIAQVVFKLVVVALCLPFLSPLVRLFAATGTSPARQIANAHTLLNIFAALLFLPLIRPYERLLRRLVPERDAGAFAPRYLEPGALAAPELAVAQVTREVLRMADIVQEMFNAALTVFLQGDKEGCRRLGVADDRVDRLEEAITGYLSRISQDRLSPALSQRVIALFYIIDELEHIADIVSKNLVSYTRKKINENLAFSDAELEEVAAFHQEVAENLRLAPAVVATWDRKLAEKLVARREWGVERKKELHNRHLQRLAQGRKETIDTSTIHLDLIADLERLNFHISQIGVAVLGTIPKTGSGQ